MVTLDDLGWWNFLSTGTHGVQMQINSNIATIITGTNGAGKSTFLDALCYNWFGKPYRKVNLPQLVNMINKKKMLTESNFRIGDKKLRVIRGMKPAKFEIYIDDVLVDQDSKTGDYQSILESYLKINYKSFCQIVLLGSANYKPFMDLALGDRREVIENLLDISVFTDMNKILKGRVKALEGDLITFKHETEVAKTAHDLKSSFRDEKQKEQKGRKDDLDVELKGYQDGLLTVEGTKKKVTDDIAALAYAKTKEIFDSCVKKLTEIANKISNNEIKIETGNSAITKAKEGLTTQEDKTKAIAKEIKRLKAEIKKLGDNAKVVVDLEAKKTLKTDINHRQKTIDSELIEVQNQIDYYENVEQCGECGQHVDDKFKGEKLAKLSDSVTMYTDETSTNVTDLIDIDKTIADMDKKVKAHTALTQSLRDEEIGLTGVQNLLQSHKNTITQQEQTIKDAETIITESKKVQLVGEQTRDGLNHDDAMAKNTILVADGVRYDADIKTTKESIVRVEGELKKLEDTIDYVVLDKEISDLHKKMSDTASRVVDVSEQLENYALVALALKDDGIKTKIIRHYLPHINETLNNFLDAFGFPVSFMFDENFKEKLLSRHRDNFSYSLFSEGEKARINLALMFTWRSIAMMKNRNAINIIIFDEVFDGSMDEAGGEAFMEIIQDAKRKGSVFVISHDDDIKSAVGFDRVIEAYKTDQFSYHREL